MLKTYKTQRYFHLYQATVELGGQITRGMMVLEKRNFTVIDALKTNKVNVVQSVDADMFKSVLVDLLGTNLAS